MEYSRGAPVWARFVEPGQNPTVEAPRKGWILPEGSTRLPPPPGTDSDCPLPYDWDRRNYAALDVETTGLDAGKDRVIEIGIVQFSIDPEGAILEIARWGSLINPGIPIPASATAIHGIEDFDVWMSPGFAEVASHVAKLVEGRVMVAHNAPFDAAFINAEFARLGLPSPFGEIADSLGILRAGYPTLLSYSLGKAAFVLGIDRGTSHRALDDAATCMRIFVQSARKMTGACP